MRILTSDEVRQAEREAVGRAGVSALVLMQRAGYAVAQFCLAHFKFSSVCVVCGKGDTGGDGLAAAESLREIAAKVSVIILAKDSRELSADVASMSSRLKLEPIWISSDSDLETAPVREALHADLIIDAIADAGFKPPLEGLARKAVEAINDAFGTVVSVDVPSGVDADSKTPVHQNDMDGVFTHGIITFIAPKPSHVLGELTTGPIAVSELGVQPALVPNKTGLQVITGQEVRIAFPPPQQDPRKGQFGHVLVIAGSLGKAGAAGLAGLAALRTGAGLVTVACPKSIESTVAGFAPELMTENLPETGEGSISMEATDKADRLLAGKDVVVLGPGLSRNEETARFIRWLVARCPLTLILDADALNAFDGHYDELKPRSEAASFRVLTPHPGEAARLTGISVGEIQPDRVETAQRIFRETGCCVVLKGWRTVVAGVSGETWLNMTGNSALDKAGSGDVLSGMIGAALARHAGSVLPIGEAAGPSELNSRVERAGDPHPQWNSEKASAFLKDISVAASVYLHGLAADIGRDTLHENSLLATDLLENLAEAFRDCDLQMDRSLFHLHK